MVHAGYDGLQGLGLGFRLKGIEAFSRCCRIKRKRNWKLGLHKGFYRRSN